MKSGLRTHSPPASGGEGGNGEKCDDDDDEPADAGEISSVGE